MGDKKPLRDVAERLRSFARNGVVAMREDKGEPSAAHCAEEGADEIVRLRAALAERPRRTDEQIVAECNELAREFYEMEGCIVAPGYRFEKAVHPREQLMWLLACHAFERLQMTPVQEALENVEDDAPLLVLPPAVQERLHQAAKGLPKGWSAVWVSQSDSALEAGTLYYQGPGVITTERPA